jgi:hypothetical protein
MRREIWDNKMFQETEISDERELKNRANNKWKGREENMKM